MKELSYPFNIDYIINNRKSIIENLKNKDGLLPKRIAILSGSNFDEAKTYLQMFLLNFGINSEFFDDDYNKYTDEFCDFKNLKKFDPDIIYIYTCNKNISNFPTMITSDVDKMLFSEYRIYESLWNNLFANFDVPIIQNNFEYYFYRLLGNRDSYDVHGRTNFITRLNQMFYDYANIHKNFFICDINYISSCYGLDKWFNNGLWHLYKYAVDIKAVPYLSFNVASIIKSIFDQNKKAIVLDLDNTIWGGVIADVGIGNLDIGNDTALGETFSEFQTYLKDLKNNGVLLNINSKNTYENALMGLQHTFTTLKKEDFIIIKANFESKDINLKDIADDLNLTPSDIVFLDDNELERKVISNKFEDVGIPDLDIPENFLRYLDRNNYFEMTYFDNSLLEKNKLYEIIAKRSQMLATSDKYSDYLTSLEMKAEICSFEENDLKQILDLINNCDRFNLTNKVYSFNDIISINNNYDVIKLSTKISDIFIKNNLVSSVIAIIKGNILYIDSWVMDFNYINRTIENALLDELVIKAKEHNIKKIFGTYNRNQNNDYVSDFYDKLEFKLLDDDIDDKTYILDVPTYHFKNEFIKIVKHD